MVGANLMIRQCSRHRVDRCGRAFLDHARLALAQVAAAREAARRACRPPDCRSRWDFLTGKEIDWLPEAIRLLRDELPNIEITVSSQYSPDSRMLLSGASSTWRSSPRSTGDRY